MHQPQNAKPNEIMYKVLNCYSDDKRYINFISDAPHLLKTTRNFFANSFAHFFTRKLWVSLIEHWCNKLPLDAYFERKIRDKSLPYNKPLCSVSIISYFLVWQILH